MKLELNEISFGYDKEIIFDRFSHVFTGPGLNIILGPNGVGKSTLIKIIAGVIKPHRGSLTLDGRPIARGEVSYVPQDNELLPWLTVFSNVELSLAIAGVGKSERRSRVIESLRIVGMLDKAYSYPKKLSGGERKRVAIARALASNSKVILLDEPTANIDPGGRRVIWSILKTLAREKLIIVVTHDIGEALIEGETIYVMTSRPARIAETMKGGEASWIDVGRLVRAYYTA